MLTGISEESVRNAPSFPEVWEKIEPFMSGGLLVAHNAQFDMGVLKKCLLAYEIEWKPCAHYICTVQMGRRLLPGISHKLNDLSQSGQRQQSLRSDSPEISPERGRHQTVHSNLLAEPVKRMSGAGVRHIKNPDS